MVPNEFNQIGSIDIVIPAHWERSAKEIFDVFVNALTWRYIGNIHVTIDPPKNGDNSAGLKIAEELSKMYASHVGRWSWIKSANLAVHVPDYHLGMRANKEFAMTYADTLYAALWDSDNIFYTHLLPSSMEGYSYLPHATNLFAICPVVAAPSFSFRDLTGGAPITHVDGVRMRNFLAQNKGEVFLNTCNYIVNKNLYLRVAKAEEEFMKSTGVDPRAADSAFTLYCAFKKGYYVSIDAGYQYQHTVHEGSTFLKDVNESMKAAAKIKQLFIQDKEWKKD